MIRYPPVAGQEVFTKTLQQSAKIARDVRWGRKKGYKVKCDRSPIEKRYMNMVSIVRKGSNRDRNQTDLGSSLSCPPPA